MMRRFLPSLALFALGCGDITTDISIAFERPRDDAPLSSVDNATLTLRPDGFSEQFAIDGPNAEFVFELPPDDVARTLSVFYARGETLVAYGETPPFTFAGAADAGVVVFLGYPGTVATLDRAFDLPDASTVVTPARGRGAIALGSDGSAVFLDAYTYALVALAPLVDGPPPEDGVFVGNTTGSATRVSFETEVSAFRFVFATDSWVGVRDPDRALRPGAAAWHDPEEDVVYVAGGGETDSILTVTLANDDSPPEFGELEGIQLDGPRAGAALLGRAGEGSASLVVFGGDDPSLPLALAPESGRSSTVSDIAWTGATCIDLDASRTLCAGGQRDETTTSDGAVIEPDADGLTVTMAPDLLGVPMRRVLWLSDDNAVYAQGEGRLIRIARDTLEVTEPVGTPQRAVRGGAAELPTGAVLLAGGEDVDGAAVDVWQIFTPAIE